MPTGFGGSGGLSTVSVAARLTGNGTGGSPLDISGLPLTFLQTGIALDSDFSPAANNQVAIAGFVIPYALTFANIGVGIHTVDAVNSYDIGLYSKAGTLIANIGAQTLPSGGFITFATLQGSITIPPGLYAFAMTGTATTAKIYQSTHAFGWIQNTNAGTSSGGTLPASITALTVTGVATAPILELF